MTLSNVSVEEPTGDTSQGLGIFATDRSIIAWIGGGVSEAEAASPSYSGGALYLEDSSTFTGSDLIFAENTAYNGGALEITDGSSANLTNVTFEGNVANRAGGALRASSSAEVTCNNCSFDSNEADRGGAVDVSGESTFTDVGGTYTDNAATTQDGGAIRVFTDGELSVTGAVFEGNESEQAGGAIYLYQPDDAVFIANTQFQNNGAATGDGGAIAADVTTSLAVNACSFDDNTTSLGSGGAIAFGPVNPGHFLTVRESSFESNQAEDDGGAIFAEEGDSVTVEDNTFLRNRAPSGNGGAVAGRQRRVHLPTRDLPRQHCRPLRSRRSPLRQRCGWRRPRGELHLHREHGGRWWRNPHSGCGGADQLAEHHLRGQHRGGRWGPPAPRQCHRVLREQHRVVRPGRGGLYAGDAGSASGSDFYYSDVGNNSGGDYTGTLSDPTGGSGNISGEPLFREFSIDGDEDNDDLYLFVESMHRHGDPSIVDVDGTATRTRAPTVARMQMPTTVTATVTTT